MSDSKKVYLSYDKIAEPFTGSRSQQFSEKKYFEPIANNLPAQAAVLDLGCGSGLPILKYFVGQGFDCIGVDASKSMLDIAKKNLPETTFILAEMEGLLLNRPFNLIIAWHSFFHLTGSAQKLMFPIFNKHLLPGGYLVFTSGPEEGEAWGDNYGESLYHASLSAEDYKRSLMDNQMKVLLHVVEDPECGGATVWVAQKDF